MIKLIKSAAFAGALLCGALLASAPATADTPDLAVSNPGVVLLPIHLQGQFGASVTAAARLKLPFRAHVLGVSASARASGGSSPTLTVNVKEAGTTILSAPVAVTAGAVAEATLADTAIADEALVTVDLTIGGGSPTWDDIDVLITLARY